MLRSIAKAVGKPIVRHPERFTPRLKHACRIDRDEKSNLKKTPRQSRL
jgi:hypothetical protein